MASSYVILKLDLSSIKKNHFYFVQLMKINTKLISICATIMGIGHVPNPVVNVSKLKFISERTMDINTAFSDKYI